MSMFASTSFNKFPLGYILPGVYIIPTFEDLAYSNQLPINNLKL